MAPKKQQKTAGNGGQKKKAANSGQKKKAVNSGQNKKPSTTKKKEIVCHGVQDIRKFASLTPKFSEKSDDEPLIIAVVKNDEVPTPSTKAKRRRVRRKQKESESEDSIDDDEPPRKKQN